jgi:hypothetical protein
MIEEALSGTTPQINNPADFEGKTPTPSQRQAVAQKSTVNSKPAAGRSTGRNERLITHLLIGFMMTVIAVAGYTFLGPHTDVNAAEQLGSQIVNIAADSPAHNGQSSIIDSASQMNDLAAMQAEMDAIMYQMNALKHGNLQPAPSMSASPSIVSNVPYNNGNGSNLDQASSTLNQMMLMTHEMITQMNSLSYQPGGASAPGSGAGHGHH